MCFNNEDGSIVDDEVFVEMSEAPGHIMRPEDDACSFERSLVMYEDWQRAYLYLQMYFYRAEWIHSTFPPPLSAIDLFI